MNTKKITPILRYVVNLEARLSCWDGNAVHWQNELTTLQKQIEELMKLTSQEKEGAKRSLLGFLELRARQCKNCILTRTGMKN